jgi:hypothetical protein
MTSQPECAKLLTQTEISLRAIRLHLDNYQLQILRLSLQKPVEIVSAQEDHKEK